MGPAGLHQIFFITGRDLYIRRWPFMSNLADYLVKFKDNSCILCKNYVTCLRLCKSDSKNPCFVLDLDLITVNSELKDKKVDAAINRILGGFYG